MSCNVTCKRSHYMKQTEWLFIALRSSLCCMYKKRGHFFQLFSFLLYWSLPKKVIWWQSMWLRAVLFQLQCSGYLNKASSRWPQWSSEPRSAAQRSTALLLSSPPRSLTPLDESPSKYLETRSKQASRVHQGNLVCSGRRGYRRTGAAFPGDEVKQRGHGERRRGALKKVRVWVLSERKTCLNKSVTGVTLVVCGDTCVYVWTWTWANTRSDASCGFLRTRSTLSAV